MGYDLFKIQIISKTNRIVTIGQNPPRPITVSHNPIYEKVINIFIKWLREYDNKSRVEDDVKIFGSILFRMLLGDNDALFIDSYKKKVLEEKNKLRVILEFNNHAEVEKMAVWPWEYIYLPDHGKPGYFLAADDDIVLTRQVPLNFQHMLKKSDVLNILIIISKPTKGSNDEEEPKTIVVDEIVTKIKNLKEWGKNSAKNGKSINVDVHELIQPTKSKLKNLVDAFYKEDKIFHIVHFIGHGKYVRDNQNEKKGGYLGFTKPDDAEVISWLAASAFAECFKNKEPHLVFLNACEGAMSDSYESFSGMALKLVFSLVPGVIAMQYPVTNGVASGFAKTFYNSLCEGNDIDVAVQEGRKEIGWFSDEANNFTNRDFGSPVVYLQKTDGFIITSKKTITETKPTEEQLLCPNCNGEITKGHSACRNINCRTKIEPCPKCPKLMLAKEEFCPWCGYDAQEALPAQKRESGNERTKLHNDMNMAKWSDSNAKTNHDDEH